MNKIRIGIIGMGSMGKQYAECILKGEVPNAELTAVYNRSIEKVKWVSETYGEKIKIFDNVEVLFASKEVDAVLIATPHNTHPSMAMEAFKCGLHVLIEKPAGVYTKEVREMNAAALKSNKVFGIMYNQRTNPLYEKLKDLIDSGELGKISRSNLVITDTFRSQSYYDSSDWRATWAGEGGGVLINQGAHVIDLWQWTCGMPKRVRAFMSFGKYHDIEVEDDVTAYVEYENGATGVFITSTGEAPGTNRFEVIGDNGKVIIEDNKLTFWRNRVSASKFSKEHLEATGQPESFKCEVPITGGGGGRPEIIRNWVNAIQKSTKLLAPGIEGINGLLISNAMHLSAWTDSWVNIPFDEDLFYEKLQEKAINSSYREFGKL